MSCLSFNGISTPFVAGGFPKCQWIFGLTLARIWFAILGLENKGVKFYEVFNIHKK